MKLRKNVAAGIMMVICVCLGSTTGAEVLEEDCAITVEQSDAGVSDGSDMVSEQGSLLIEEGEQGITAGESGSIAAADDESWLEDGETVVLQEETESAQETESVQESESEAGTQYAPESETDTDPSVGYTAESELETEPETKDELLEEETEDELIRELGAALTEEHTWTVGTLSAVLSVDGTLTISGAGAIPDYERTADVPWADYVRSIKQLVLSDDITSIGNDAFAYCSGITSVKLPEKLTTIGEAAFYQCDSLQSVLIPDLVTEIKEGAFADCTAVTAVTLGQSVRKVGQYAFQLTQITSLYLPAAVAEFDGYSCYNCPSLENYQAADGNAAYRSQEGVLFSKDGTTLIACPAEKKASSYVVPGTVTTIGESAFIDNKNLTSIQIPGSVTKIEDFAFCRCQALQEIQLPDSVTSIGTGCFAECPVLKKAALGNGVQVLPYILFSECSQLEEAVLGSNTTELDLRVFYKCAKLSKITLPQGLKTIRVYAFYGCTSLTSLTIPSSVTLIEGGAFRGTDQLVLNYEDSSLEEQEDGSYRKMEAVTLSGTCHYGDAYEVLNCVNVERLAAGLPELSMDQELLNAAMLRACEIQLNFSHTRPSGMDCFTVSSKAEAENIAAGSSNADGVMDQWMNSPGHRGNILTEKFQSIGIGCFEQRGTKYWVQIFSSEAAVTGSQPADRAVTSLIKVEPADYSSGMSLLTSEYDEVRKTIKCGQSFSIIACLQNPGWTYASAILDPSSMDYNSSNPSAITVDEAGKVTGTGPGTAVITVASKNGPSLTHSVTIQCRMDLSTAAVKDLPDCTYTGKAIQPEIVVTYSGKTLQKDTDYKVSYAYNVNIGQAKVVISGLGNYAGSITKYFKIVEKKTAKSFSLTLSKSSYTYTGKAFKPKVTVKVNGKAIAAKYYTVKYSNNKNVGTATVTVTGKGTYKGSQAKKTFKINLKKTTLSSVKSSGKKKIQVKWKKDPQCGGYKIQYCTNNKFSKGAVTITIKNNKTVSHTISKLKSGKKYYVRIRSYKTVGKNTLYSSWSKVSGVSVK